MIPNKIGKALVWILLVFMLFDSVLSVFAVYRWSERVKGVKAESAVSVFLDNRFPESRMEEIYPNMEFLAEK